MNQPIPNHPSRPAFPWHAFLRELTLFRRRYGHCAVPQDYLPSPRLAAWSQSLRNRISRLSVEQLRRLAKMDFDFGRLNNSWLHHFLHAIQLKEQGGYWDACAKDIHLVRWLSKQRAHRADLAPDRVELLNRTGFFWDRPRVAHWHRHYDELREFHRRHGGLRALIVSRFYGRGGGVRNSDEKEAKRLAVWLQVQRVYARKGKLSEDQKRLLATLGVDWRDTSERWEQLYRRLADFRKEQGHGNATESSKNAELAHWANLQRHSWLRLDAERRHRLEKLGFFASLYKTRWEQRYLELAAFKKRYGHCCPPVHGRYAVLGYWVTAHRSRRLTPDQRKRLNALGFDWDPFHTQWMQRFVNLQAFHQRFGHTDVPAGWREDPLLRVWTHKQRRFFHEGKLDPRHIRLLNRVGFAWNWSPAQTYHAHWMERYGKLHAFHQRFGHANVPGAWREDPALGAWVATQRAAHRRRELSQRRIRLLDRLGIEWNPLASAWMKRYAALRTFRKRFGHAHVPHRWKEDPSLVVWTELQRERHLAGRLSRTCVRLLDAVGFDPMPLRTRWMKRYAALEAFRKRFGHVQVPRGWKENPTLAWWVRTQRNLHREGRLAKDYEKLLRSIGFGFSTRRRRL